MQSLIDEKEAARILGLSVITLRNFRCQRRGPSYYKIGKAVRYSLDDLMDFIKERRITPERSDDMGMEVEGGCCGR